jgi:TonB family protein
MPKRRQALVMACSVLVLCVSGMRAQDVSRPDPFYLSLFEKAQKSFLAKSYSDAARDFEIAAFGLAADKTLKARALTYLGLAHYYLKDIGASEKCLREAADLVGENGFISLNIHSSASADLERLLAFFGIKAQAEGGGAEAERPSAADPGAGKVVANPPPQKPPTEGQSPAIPDKPLNKIQEGDLLPVDIVDTVPTVIKRVEPVYPAAGKRLKVGGKVIINVLVSEKGDVVKAEVVQGINAALGFNQESLRAVRQWKFNPASIKGIRVKVWWTVAFEFKPEATE